MACVSLPKKNAFAPALMSPFAFKGGGRRKEVLKNMTHKLHVSLPLTMSLARTQSCCIQQTGKCNLELCIQWILLVKQKGEIALGENQNDDDYYYWSKTHHLNFFKMYNSVTFGTILCSHYQCLNCRTFFITFNKTSYLWSSSYSSFCPNTSKL